MALQKSKNTIPKQTTLVSAQDSKTNIQGNIPKGTPVPKDNDFQLQRRTRKVRRSFPMRPNRQTTPMEQSRGLPIRPHSPHSSGRRQYHKQLTTPMHRSKPGKGSPDGRGIHRPMQRDRTTRRVQDMETNGQDHEWINTLARLYDQGYPTIPHSHTTPDYPRTRKTERK